MLLINLAEWVGSNEYLIHSYSVMSRASKQPLQMGSKVIDVIRISLEVSKSGKINSTLKETNFLGIIF